MPKTCKTCGAELVITRIPALKGEGRGWRAELVGYPVLTCPDGHVRREAYADFNTEWSAVLGDAQDLWLKPRGILRREFRCSRCGGHLQEPVQETLQRSVEVARRPGYTFAVAMTGPILSCEACKHRWIREPDSAEIFEALANALGTGGIRRY